VPKPLKPSFPNNHTATSIEYSSLLSSSASRADSTAPRDLSGSSSTGMPDSIIFIWTAHTTHIYWKLRFKRLSSLLRIAIPTDVDAQASHRFKLPGCICSVHLALLIRRSSTPSGASWAQTYSLVITSSAEDLRGVVVEEYVSPGVHAETATRVCFIRCLEQRGRRKRDDVWRFFS